MINSKSKSMKLYEAIATIVQEFGKEIVTNAKVINVFSDYNAFEESKTFKVILKNLIAEGYMDQLMYVRDWSSSQSRIISNFIAATSFNEANASYVIRSLAYGLGYTKTVPVYQSSASSQQTTTSSHPTSVLPLLSLNPAQANSSPSRRPIPRHTKELHWTKHRVKSKDSVKQVKEDTRRLQKPTLKASLSSKVTSRRNWV